MNRIACLTLIAVSVAATAVFAGPFRKRQPPPVPSREPVYHRTYCVGWSDPRAAQFAADERPLLWILDGAGDLKGCSNALKGANAAAGEPLDIEVFPWSHGYRKLLRDQIGAAHAREQGQRLAAEIIERRAREPRRRMIVVGHSAGCAVALAACDALPVDTIDRIVLLAPSVSTTYDIRPSLWSAKEGMDVFCSTKDWVALGFVIRVVGTTDSFWSHSAAGRWGFKPKKGCGLSELEGLRLRQHFWSEEIAWTGHDGGHHGVHAPDFVRCYLLPLMWSN